MNNITFKRNGRGPVQGKFYDPDIEADLITLLALEPHIMWPEVQSLTPAHFGNAPARRAWSEIAETIRGGAVVDAARYHDFFHPLDPPPMLATHAGYLAGELVRLTALRRASGLADDLIKAAHAGDEAHIRGLLNGAPDLLRNTTDGTLVPISSIADRVLAILENPDNATGYILPTGLALLDDCLGGGLEAGTLAVVMGRPGMGKTALLVQISDLVSEAGGVVAVFTKEMTTEQWAIRAACRRARVSWFAYRQKKLMPDEHRRLQEEAHLIVYRNTLSVDGSTPQTTDQMYDLCARVKRERGGLDLVIADHLRFFADAGETENKRQGHISWGMKQLAKRLGTRVICAAQLNRGVERSHEKRPDLADLRDSGEIEENADIVLALYREGYYNGASADHTAEVIVRKDRNGARNRVAKFVFMPQWMGWEPRNGHDGR